MTNQQRVNLRDVVATKVLRVPDYQRPYAWGLSQLQDLWDDLDLAGPRSKHYAGTLIFKPHYRLRRPSTSTGSSRFTPRSSMGSNA